MTKEPSPQQEDRPHKEAKMINHKTIFISFLLFFTIILSACSLHPQKMSASKVEEIGKEAINERVYLSDTEPRIEDSYAGRQYIYSFMDERGIPFTVKMTSPYFSLVEYIKGFYENYVEFRTDYSASVMNYYYEQVEDIFESVDGISFDDKDKKIIRISDESALESLEDILMSMDALYDFDYAYCGELRLKLSKKAYWEDYRPFDMLIRYNGKQEKILFSVSDDESISKESIREIIENLK